MTATTIRVAAAVIVDTHGRLLLVRKRGTHCFMQAGGKIAPGETPLAAVCREVGEEVGVTPEESDVRYLGRYVSAAANEPDHLVDAELFFVTLHRDPLASAEIDELLWLDPADAARLPIAPLTRDHVLPLLAVGTP